VLGAGRGETLRASRRGGGASFDTGRDAGRDGALGPNGRVGGLLFLMLRGGGIAPGLKEGGGRGGRGLAT
jgi:hypothetical protein